MTEPKLESIKEISDYLDMKYKTKLLLNNWHQEFPKTPQMPYNTLMHTETSLCLI